MRLLNGQIRNFFWKSAKLKPPTVKYTPNLQLAAKTTHRPYNLQDSQFLRHVMLNDEVKHVKPEENPGVRLHPDVMTPADLSALRKDCLEPLMKVYAFTTLNPYTQAVYEAQMMHLPNAPSVNMARITGREESDLQKRAPWLYGDEFNMKKVPSLLLNYIKKLYAIPDLNLGPVRDITINFRQESYLRLDPHLDPTDDGENVLILSLSPTVITMSPLDLLKQIEADPKAAMEEATSLGFNSIEEKRAKYSYTPHDVDCWVPTGSVCHLDADGRWTWTHATRLGVAGPDGKLYDWFGIPSDLKPRETDRFSVVVAFGKPGEKGGTLEDV